MSINNRSSDNGRVRAMVRAMADARAMVRVRAMVRAMVRVMNGKSLSFTDLLDFLVSLEKTLDHLAVP